MPSKPESKFWKRLQKTTLDQGVHWTRLESWAVPGVPDLHGIINGYAFWVVLKINNLKSLKSISLSPLQISWQIQYCDHGGKVWNLVDHPSSRTVNLFWGGRAQELAMHREPLTADWSENYDSLWGERLIKFILAH